MSSKRIPVLFDELPNITAADEQALCVTCDYLDLKPRSPWCPQFKRALPFKKRCPCYKITTAKGVHDQDGNAYLGLWEADMSRLRRWRTLAIGTRFQYVANGKLFVKIAHDTCVEWDDAEIDTTWIGQHHFCFDENDDFEKKVIVVC